jgi:hypothetical protein
LWLCCAYGRSSLPHQLQRMAAPRLSSVMTSLLRYEV